VQKTREIGVMKAVGMSRSLIARVFLFQGTIIGVLGTAIGTLLGTLIVVFREQIADFLSWILRHDVFPAELYHLRRIPALITASDMTFIVCLALVICIMASIIPAIYASFKEPARALQEDN
ncbi:MAG: ABC transporter permease, partial [Victivallales bacterium]|nr:ABC transporter permease [Victivallales bacterium]